MNNIIKLPIPSSLLSRINSANMRGNIKEEARLMFLLQQCIK